MVQPIFTSLPPHTTTTILICFKRLNAEDDTNEDDTNFLIGPKQTTNQKSSKTYWIQSKVLKLTNYRLEMETVIHPGVICRYRFGQSSSSRRAACMLILAMTSGACFLFSLRSRSKQVLKRTTKQKMRPALQNKENEFRYDGWLCGDNQIDWVQRRIGFWQPR